MACLSRSVVLPADNSEVTMAKPKRLPLWPCTARAMMASSARKMLGTKPCSKLAVTKAWNKAWNWRSRNKTSFKIQRTQSLSRGGYLLYSAMFRSSNCLDMIETSPFQFKYGITQWDACEHDSRDLKRCSQVPQPRHCLSKIKNMRHSLKRNNSHSKLKHTSSLPRNHLSRICALD